MAAIRKLFLILFLLLPLTVFPDTFKIPFSCWPKKIQAEFAKYGRKLDLSGLDRNDDSWGFIESKGSSYVIYTYYPTNPKDREIIIKVVNKEYDG